jgi:hypothetical protein
MLLFVRVVEELRVVVFQVRDAGVLGFDRVQEVPGSAVLQVVLLGQLEDVVESLFEELRVRKATAHVTDEFDEFLFKEFLY